MKNMWWIVFNRVSTILNANYLILSAALVCSGTLWAAGGLCPFSFEEGHSVVVTPLLPEVRNSYFGKKFDYAPIRALYRASGRATVEFIEAQGVRIFKIPKIEAGCEYFASATLAPVDLQKYWNSATTQSQNEEGPSGLFVEKNSYDVPSARFSAQIGLRIDADRWVLMHEYMHHQFDREASRTGLIASGVRLALEEKTRRLKLVVKSYEATGGVKKLKLAIRTYLETAPLIRELAIRYPLEEVAIETFLQIEYRAGHFDFMPFSADVSNGYILTSAMRATKMLDEYSALERLLGDAAKQSGLVQLVAALQKESDANTELKLQIISVLGETDG